MQDIDLISSLELIRVRRVIGQQVLKRIIIYKSMFAEHGKEVRKQLLKRKTIAFFDEDNNCGHCSWITQVRVKVVSILDEEFACSVSFIQTRHLQKYVCVHIRKGTNCRPVLESEISTQLLFPKIQFSIYPQKMAVSVEKRVF